MDSIIKNRIGKINKRNIKDIIISWKNKYVYKRVYIGYAKRAVKDIINEEDYDNEFLQEIRSSFIRHSIPRVYGDVNDPELLRCIDYVNKNKPEMFCCDEARASYYDIEDIHYDENAELYYGYWCGKRLYFKRSINSAEAARSYLSNSIFEQSTDSPHRYLTEMFNVSEGGVVFDIGGAEGNFALTVIDRASKVYIFECDDEWIEALNHTFEDYKDKVVIIKKYVSDKNSDRTITIDHALQQFGMTDVDMIKMDIEGAEISAIRGAKDSIDKGRIAKWAVCTYHNPTDADIIAGLLKDYQQEFSKGYIMSAVWNLRLKYPYWVKGVLRAYADR